MGEYERVIFFKNAVETLGSFSEQIAIEFEHQGIETYFIDYDYLYQTMEGLSRFAEKGKVALLTFNFIGLSGEEIFLTEEGRYIWEEYDARILNILVDHPMYYHTKLEKIYRNMQVFCIDREHVNYIERFYQHVNVTFLPSAGNVRTDIDMPFLRGREQMSSGVVYRDYEEIWDYEIKLKDLEKRDWDVVFTGNYVPTYLFEKSLKGQGEEYQKFYQGMIDDLLAQPQQVMDEVLEYHIKRELGEVSETDLREILGNLIFIDQWVRSELRSRVLSSLINHDIVIYAVGADWDLFPCKKPWNMKRSRGMVSSAECVEIIRNARISLNVMPWFRDGAHDRVFTAMLQKTVSVTDESQYLKEHFTDGEDIVFYSLDETEMLAERIQNLLESPNEMDRIAQNGYEHAFQEDTWRTRAMELLTYL